MKAKRTACFMLAIYFALFCTPSLSFAYGDKVETDNVQYFEWISLSESSEQPRINSDGTFSYSFKSRLHSSYFRANSTSLVVSFQTSSNTNAYYYITLYDGTDSTTNPSVAGFTLTKDDCVPHSKTFSVTPNHKYRLTFSKLNPKNNYTVVGTGSLVGALI